MNKKELINLAAQEAGISKTDMGKAFAAIIKTIDTALKQEKNITILGFGNFHVKEKSSRNGFNPRTCKPIKIEAKKVVKFNPSDSILNEVNSK